MEQKRKPRGGQTVHFHKGRRGFSHPSCLLLCVLYFLGIVENTTYPEAEGAPWEGTLVEEWIDLNEDSTMMGCIVKALEKNGYKQTGAENNYISSIQGLGEFDGGSMSGWMGTLNDWFTNYGFGAFTVAGGTLGSGDEIRIMYTRNGYGADLGGSWDNHIKTVKALTFSAGELSPAFDPDTHEYTLTVDKGTDSVLVTPTASNKNYQVRTYVGETEYKRTAMVPTVDGTTITVKCGDPSWPNMNGDNEPAQVYTVNVKVKSGDKPVTPTNTKVLVRAQDGGAWLHQPMVSELTGGEAEKYGFTDKVEGVSVLDALVAAHVMVYGDKFTPATAKQYLAINPNNDWESKVFGRETGFHGFYINGDFPTNEAGATRPKVTDTKLLDGDVLDYFVGSDAENQNDYYTWLEVPATMTSGEDITVTVKGVQALDPDATQANAQPLEGVGLAWLDMTTGTIKPIDGVVTDENGKATFTVVEGAATGYLVATTATYHTHTTYALMNPSEQIKMVSGNVHTVELKGLHNAQLNSLKLYTYKNGVKGTQDLLSGISTMADGYGLKYTAKLASGTYWVEGYDANKDCNGGMEMVIADDTTSVSVQRAYEIYARNSGWVAGTDYTIDYQVTTADGVKRTATLGSGTVYGNLRTTGIFVETDTVTVNLIPSEAHTANYNVGTKTVVTKVGGGAQSFAISVPKAYTVKVTAPAGSTVSVGTFGNYYTYEFLRPLEDSTATKDGDTVTVTYRAPETSLNHFVRVQNPDGVTYWDFNKWTTDQDIVVTRDDLHMDDDFNKDTVSRFDKNTYDLGNVYLNINSKGYMNMNAGDTYELDVFRNWQAIEGFMNAKIALPDAHYEVVDFDGKPSDVVSIAPNADNSCLAYMTANHQGTALVKVTYDAMTHKQGQSSTADKTFSAIWPEFTGVFVVSVGADGTAIQTNMLMDRMDVGVTKDEQKQLDAEHDILFYLGTDGASYTFTPESGCTVTVARSTVGKTMTFNGFTSQGVTVDAETGAVTVANLTTGRHIVRVEKDGVATYQVITARGVSYKLLDAEGNELPENAEVKPGETVQLQFTGLVSPKEKMSGVYNHNFSLYYTDGDGNSFKSNPGGGYGVYDFSGNPARQRISITVPADQEGLTYELTGAIKVGGFAGKPTHRIVTYAKGMGMQYGTTTANVLAQLPQVTLKLSGYAADAVEKLIDAIGTVTLNSEEAIKAARDAYDALTEEQKAQVGNYQTLLDAEAKLADLQAADAVEKLIDAIGTVTLDSEEAIKAARGAYDALTEEQKELVGNYQTLLDAEAKLADLKAADAVEKLIDAIGTVTLDSEEAIKAARGAYDALTEEQKAQVGNYQTLLDAEAKLAQLKKDAEKPSQPEQPAKPSEDANKPATGDAGVALWLTVMCMTSLLGAALVGKKRKA